MNNLVHQMIKKKFKQMSKDELLQYSNQYNIHITQAQASKITTYLNKTDLNPVDETDRLHMFKKLAQITDVQTAQQAQKLFNKLIKKYGVESWFK